MCFAKGQRVFMVNRPDGARPELAYAGSVLMVTSARGPGTQDVFVQWDSGARSWREAVELAPDMPPVDTRSNITTIELGMSVMHRSVPGRRLGTVLKFGLSDEHFLAAYVQWESGWRLWEPVDRLVPAESASNGQER